MRFRERTLTTEKSTLFKCLVLLLQFCWSQKAGREFNKITKSSYPVGRSAPALPSEILSCKSERISSVNFVLNYKELLLELKL